MKPIPNHSTLFILSIILLWQLAHNSFAQTLPLKITWKDLQDVKFKKKLNQQENMLFLYPTFGEKIKAIEGKEVQIKGYMIPVDPAGNLFVLSANPFAACFFCGRSGPESVIQLKLKQPRRFMTDEVWTVRGTLKLNVDNIDELNYILLNTEVVKKGD